MCQLSAAPVGFENVPRAATLPCKGRVARAFLRGRGGVSPTDSLAVHPTPARHQGVYARLDALCRADPPLQGRVTVLRLSHETQCTSILTQAKLIWAIRS